MRTSVITIGCFFAILGSFAAFGFAQDCVLKVRAWEAYSDRDSTDDVSNRKSALSGFSSTVVNEKSQRIYKGVYAEDYAFYEDIPPGSYNIKVTKPGFKTTVQSHNFMCSYAADGVDFVDVLLYRGSPKQIVNGKEPGQSKVVVLNDRDGPPTQPHIFLNPPRKTVSGGVLNGKAVYLPDPNYPPAARAVGASGAVQVQVLINEEGRVISASAAGGHPLLQPAAVAAARESQFKPASLSGQPVRVSGVITYNFVP
jgi:TonB family protein